WDMTAPSYVHPFIDKRAGHDPDPGFVVADVVINGQVTLPQVRSFIRKCEVLWNQRHSRPLMAMFIADNFHPEAFSLLRKKGCLAISIPNLLGQDLADALKSLIAILSNTATAAETKPEIITQV